MTIVFLAGLAAAMRWLRPVLETSTGLPPLALTFSIVAAWIVLFLAVIWATYQPKK